MKGYPARTGLEQVQHVGIDKASLLGDLLLRLAMFEVAHPGCHEGGGCDIFVGFVRISERYSFATC